MLTKDTGYSLKIFMEVLSVTKKFNSTVEINPMKV